MNGEGVTVKDLIQQMSQEINRRLDRIDDKMDRKADDARLDRVDARLLVVENNYVRIDAVEDVREALLSPEKVKEMIGVAMQDSQARGWTNRERWMGLAIFAFTAVNFVVGLLALGPDLFGGK